MFTGVGRYLNQFLAGILIIIYHLVVGMFIDRTSIPFIISMYIFVLTMLQIVGMPVEEETGQIQEKEVNFHDRFGF